MEQQTMENFDLLLNSDEFLHTGAIEIVWDKFTSLTRDNDKVFVSFKCEADRVSALSCLKGNVRFVAPVEYEEGCFQPVSKGFIATVIEFIRGEIKRREQR